MDYINTIKQLRKLKNIKIKDMILGKSRFSYSRIEKGETKCNLGDLEQILNSLEITPNELVQFTEYNNDYENYKKLLNECIDQPNNSLKTNELLRRYYNPHDIDKKTKIELLYLVGIVGNFSGKLTPVKLLNKNDLLIIYKRIKEQTYFTEYDYHIVLNIMTLLPEEMLDQLINLMYPVKFPEKRSQSLLRYSTTIVTNLVSIFIYQSKYKKALYYAELLEKNTDVTKNYYLYLNIMYHKNIALHFYKNDTLYIENARSIIKIIYDIGDTLLAKTFEDELNKLIKTPGYYTDATKYSRVTPRG